MKNTKSRRYLNEVYQRLRTKLSIACRQGWHRLPISFETKQKLKRIAFEKMPYLFSGTGVYRTWKNANGPISDDWSSIEIDSLEFETLQDEFIPLSSAEPLRSRPVKIICFYLPQFHAIPENDEWWGSGFTEWTNVAPAKPLFEGHYQPHQPGELGYYDLLDVETQRRQIELAKLYGIEGFCFYFYWFGGKRLLEAPIKNYLDDKSLDLPFCLCWANENWSRRWDGLDNEILIAQQHSAADDIGFIEHIADYLRDSRYIRIDGKPLLLVYRPSLLPSAKETSNRWRKWCRENGIGEIYIAYTQSFEIVSPADYGFDAAVEFPPNNSAPSNITDKVKPLTEAFGCTVYDWRNFVKRSEAYKDPNYTLFRSVCPAWDNTARRKNRSTVFLNSHPLLYQRWLENAINHTKQTHKKPDERLVFVNAWNEWAEGAHLEPDTQYGYAYLQATRDALKRTQDENKNSVLFVTHDCHPHGAQFLALESIKSLKNNGFKVAILALDGGKLIEDFTQIGPFLNVKQSSEAAVKDFLIKLHAEGMSDAITNTVVSGSVVPLLKTLGFRILSLIHEMPGVIHDMKQEDNAQIIAKLADKVVFPADLVFRKFCDIAPVNLDRAIIQPQGVLRKNPYKNSRLEAQQLICKKHKLPLDTQIVLSIAYVDARKGPDLFVEVAAKVLTNHPNTAFIWIGHADLKMQQIVNARIKNLGLSGKVLFIGFDRDPMAYYAAAKVYALTSREDPFPNVVLESAEVGVPVVAFQDASGAADFIVDHGGRLALHLDTDDFAHQVGELLQKPFDNEYKTVSSLEQYTLDLLHYLNGFQRVSVVVPNYNYERHITKRLDSIYEQTFPIYEVIILDDASSDDSIASINKYFEQNAYPEPRFIINKDNSGSVFRQWKKGLEQCSGDLIWIAEADDLADKHFLSELSPTFSSADLVLAFSQSMQMDEHGTITADNYLDYTEDVSNQWLTDYTHDGNKEISEVLSVKNTIPNVSAVLFRRSALTHALNTLGESLFNYRVAGDWLVYLHVLTQGKIHYNKTPLNIHRRHTHSVTTSTAATNHLNEVIEAQAVAHSLVEPSSKARISAENYINYLHEYFNIPKKSTEEVTESCR
ncbi:glycoside hydrolase family 99-like domain-containing protein [Alcaligenaceae bacterium]|nr:glycoside hydrolase family 99-like domain-containing protein [Alcaligenaceae bacterium]